MKLIISQWLCCCCEETVVSSLQMPSQEDAARPLHSNQPSCVPMEGDTRLQNAWSVALIGWRLVLTRLGSWSYHGNWPRAEVTSLCPELPLCLWFELPPFVNTLRVFTRPALWNGPVIDAHLVFTCVTAFIQKVFFFKYLFIYLLQPCDMQILIKTSHDCSEMELHRLISTVAVVVFSVVHLFFIWSMFWFIWSMFREFCK